MLEARKGRGRKGFQKGRISPKGRISCEATEHVLSLSEREIIVANARSIFRSRIERIKRMGASLLCSLRSWFFGQQITLITLMGASLCSLCLWFYCWGQNADLPPQSASGGGKNPFFSARKWTFLDVFGKKCGRFWTFLDEVDVFGQIWTFLDVFGKKCGRFWISKFVHFIFVPLSYRSPIVPLSLSYRCPIFALFPPYFCPILSLLAMGELWGNDGGWVGQQWGKGGGGGTG